MENGSLASNVGKQEATDCSTKGRELRIVVGLWSDPGGDLDVKVIVKQRQLFV